MKGSMDMKRSDLMECTNCSAKEESSFASAMALFAAAVSLIALAVSIFALVKSMGRSKLTASEFDIYDGDKAYENDHDGIDDDDVGSDTLAF